MVRFPKWLADAGLQVNRLYYKGLFKSTYLSGKQPTSWFDHRIDLYYHWPYNMFWLERGILPRQHMSEGCRVLDLFCGDGFFSRYFYTSVGATIDAVDKDPKAIAHALRWHKHPKINYSVADVVKQGFPSPHYDVIAWFEAIEHLSEAEYATIADHIKAGIGAKGVLIGSTPIVPAEHLGEANWEHQNEFTSVAQLQDFLSSDFQDIQIVTTVYPVLGGGDRRTAYFTVRNPK